MTKLYVKYPMGAGGGWLSKTLNHYQFDKSRYGYFHFPTSPGDWAISSHAPNLNSYVVFSGKYKFNFFCNHAYKFLHLTANRYTQTLYQQWFKENVAVSFDLCKSCNYEIPPYFDFDDLIYDPDRFYKKITDLQSVNNRFVISKDYFDHSRNLFLQSCVNTSKHFNNLESPWWIMFVLGQLMDQQIHPEFDIGDIENFVKVKDFVKNNSYRCPTFINWDNPVGVDIDIELPL